MKNKTLILIPVLAVALAVSGCGKKETPKSVAKNTNAQQANENMNTNANLNQNTNSDVNENQGAGAVENGQSGGQGEEIEISNNTISDEVISNIKVVDMKDITLAFNPWSKDSKSFLFKTYDKTNCEIFCGYDLYKYYIEENYLEIIQPKEESLLKKDWVVSNNGKLAVKVVSGDDMQTTNEDLGTIYIKNLETNEIKTLGKRTHKGGCQDQYTFSHYNNPAWSPDDKWIAFYDYNGEVTVMRSDANDINEIKVLGKTFYIETARNDEYYTYWSPDSTKLFAKDGYPIFSVDPVAELYPSNDDEKYIKDWRWSPDSQKILGVIQGLDRLNFYIMNYDGSNKKTIISIKDVSNKDLLELNADWSPDSKDIVYAYNQNMYILDTETMNKTAIAEKGKNYLHPNWSPDGKKIIYELDDQIWMITLK
ncbi:MAG: DPP IV N-terminal domain-containing protein [bacterium]